MKELGDVVRIIFNPTTFAIITALGGFSWKLYSNLRKKLEKQQSTAIQNLVSEADEQQNLLLESFTKELRLLTDKIDNFEREYKRTQVSIRKDLLKLQIIEAIEAEETPREILYHYDQYKKLGGNSYIDERVRMYLKKFKELYPDDF